MTSSSSTPPSEACPHCGGQGWYVAPNRNTGEPEQEQCQACAERAMADVADFIAGASTPNSETDAGRATISTGYQDVFNAIAAAVSAGPNGAVNVSVEKFLANIRTFPSSASSESAPTIDRDAIIEECAKVIDARVAPDGRKAAEDYEAIRCAKAIRELKNSRPDSRVKDV